MPDTPFTVVPSRPWIDTRGGRDALFTKEPYQANNKRFLAFVVSQAANTLGNSCLYQEERRKLDAEMTKMQSLEGEALARGAVVPRTRRRGASREPAEETDDVTEEPQTDRDDSDDYSDKVALSRILFATVSVITASLHIFAVALISFTCGLFS